MLTMNIRNPTRLLSGLSPVPPPAAQVSSSSTFPIPRSLSAPAVPLETVSVPVFHSLSLDEMVHGCMPTYKLPHEACSITINESN